MKLNKDDFNKTNLDFLKDIAVRWPHVLNFNENYKFLTYLTGLFNNVLILDLGTQYGHSCLCLAQNKTNKIITYDIEDHDTRYITDHYENVEKKIMDVNLENEEIINQAKIIFLDIDPHVGIQEEIFYNKLLKTNFKGFLICDDIGLTEGMYNFWQKIEKEKFSIKDFGHWSGLGIVNFSDEPIEISKLVVINI